jgi:hypothetical protein
MSDRKLHARVSMSKTYKCGADIYNYGMITDKTALSMKPCEICFPEGLKFLSKTKKVKTIKENSIGKMSEAQKSQKRVECLKEKNMEEWI